MIRPSGHHGTTTKTAYIFLIAVLIMASVLTAFLAACSNTKRIEMRVLCAGSLMVPFEAIEKAYEAKYPDIDILIEGHGSIQVIRHVTELYEEADVMAVADHSLIPMLMYNTTMPDTGKSYASWYIQFTTNSLGIAYTPDSRYAGEINENNWYEVISRPGVKVGISDARLDACGYRAFMLLQLAETYYGDDTIFEKVLGPFNPTLNVEQTEAGTRILVPEILRPTDERIALRGSSIRLLALLESGDIDYAFEYWSVAEQHQLNFLPLPPEINLSEVEYAGLYSEVRCELDFHRFASVNPIFAGTPIIYGITIPQNAPHYDKSIQFIEFLLSDEGQQILNENYQLPLIPLEANNTDEVPEEISNLLNG